MAYSKPWTPEDIAALKIGFLKGTPLKVLSKQLNRSPTALNKALSRFRIRARSRFLTTSTLPTLRLAEPKRSHRNPSPTQLTVGLAEVVNFLCNDGYDISANKFTLNNRCYTQYLLNKKPTTPIRLLVLANTLRLERQLPIFVSNSEPTREKDSYPLPIARS